GGFTLEGEKTVVLHGDCADKLIVTARASGGRADRSGIGLFLIDGKASGVTRRGYPTQDGMRAADVTLSAGRVRPQAGPAPPRTRPPVPGRGGGAGNAPPSAESGG